MTRTSLTLSLLLLAAAAAFAQPVRVCLSEVAIVDRDVVTFGDVADLGGMDEAKAEVLASVELTSSPEPAHAMVIQKSDMELLLLRRGVDGRRVRLDGPDAVKIVREGIVIEESRIEAAIRDRVRAETGWADEDFALERLRGIEEVGVPSGTCEIEVEALSDDLARRPLFDVTLFHNGQAVRTLHVSAKLCRYIDAFVAARDLGRDELIAAEDVRRTRVDANELSSRELEGMIRSPEALVGREIRFSISEGDAITEDMIQSPTIIERGDRVVIQLTSGAVRLTASGIAGGSGREGENLRVRNLATGKYLMAAAVAPGVVTIGIGEENR
jgi:flagella basal body P-ring formation protein FlgA